MHPVEKKIQELNLELPPPPKPVGSYTPLVQSGNLAFVSGQISKRPDGALLTGKAGRDLSLEEAREAARFAILNALSVVGHGLGFDRVARIVRLTGYVQTAPDFFAIPDVLNGASDLLLAVFGEQGRHARSAVGVAGLPMNAVVEVELTLEVRP